MNTISTPSEVARLLGCDPDKDAVHRAIANQLRVLLLDEDAATQWTLEVCVSSAGPSAGSGVRLHGGCAAGTVLACYPGVSYAAEDLPLMHQLILTGNNYVVARRDGVFLDGRPDGPSAKISEIAQMREVATVSSNAAGAARHSIGPPRVFAVGNKVNHPPSGTWPNVLIYPFDLRAHEHPELHPHLCVAPFRPPADGDPLKQTAVFVATRDLVDGEELWLDYKLSLDGPVEDWYSPVPAATAMATAAHGHAHG